MRQSVTDVMEREKKAWSNKANWESLYDEAYQYARPNQDASQVAKGVEKNATIYDSTLQKSTVRLAGMLQSTITPPFTKWAKIITGPFIREGKVELQQRLEHVSEAIFAAISASSFDSAMGEFYLDYIIGTGALLVLEGDDVNPLKFVTVPIREIALEEGPDSKIGAVYRRYKKPARVIPTMWPDGKDNAKLNELLREAPATPVSISEVTYYDYEEDNWKYEVLFTKMESDNQEDAARYVERTYETNPWIIGRWIKAAGEVYGRGPVLDALPDAKTCNLAKKLELKNASLAISGVWLAKNNGIVNGNSVRIQPGAVIPVMSTGGPAGADLQRLDVGGDIQYSQIVQKDLQQSIKDAMFDRSIPDQGAVRSATEWVVRQQELQEAIGAPFGRMFQEVIRPLFNRILAILYNKGVVEEIKINGGTFDVQIVGSLAQAQALKELEAINNWGTMAIQLTGPEMFMASAKVEAIPGVMADLLGIPGILIRSEEEKAAMVQQAQQAAQQTGGTNGEPGQP